MKTEKVLWRKKYITVLILSLLILAAVLYGIRNGRRNDKGGNILAGASLDTSAFQMYYFDGETVAVRTLYDSGAEKEVIKKINGIPLQAAEEDALSQMEPPFYGFWVSSQDGFDISVAASGGVWLKELLINNHLQNMPNCVILCSNNSGDIGGKYGYKCRCFKT